MVQPDLFASVGLEPPVRLTREEAMIYEMICIAAERGEPCPVNIDLEVAVGFNSTSMGPKTVQRLEAKGLIQVERAQKVRRVLVCATGKSTVWPSWHKSGVKRMDRGSHSTGPLVTALVKFGVDRSIAVERVRTHQGVQQIERDLDRLQQLARRRMNGFAADRGGAGNG